MFSMKSTWKEIKTTKPVDTALGDLFPTCWSILLQGHEEETMEQIHDRVHMEWGEAFWSQPLVNCANMLMETGLHQHIGTVYQWLGPECFAPLHVHPVMDLFHRFFLMPLQQYAPTGRKQISQCRIHRFCCFYFFPCRFH